MPLLRVKLEIRPRNRVGQAFGQGGWQVPIHPPVPETHRHGNIRRIKSPGGKVAGRIVEQIAGPLLERPPNRPGHSSAYLAIPEGRSIIRRKQMPQEPDHRDRWQGPDAKADAADHHASDSGRSVDQSDQCPVDPEDTARPAERLRRRGSATNPGGNCSLNLCGGQEGIGSTPAHPEDPKPLPPEVSYEASDILRKIGQI